MKLWALILAAGTILAFAAPAATAASSPAGLGGSARPAGAVLHTDVVFRDPLHGRTAFLRPLDRPRSSATKALVAGGGLDALLAPRPSVWSQVYPLLPWGFWWIL